MVEAAKLAQEIKQKARSLGADAAGLAAWPSLVAGPSPALEPQLAPYDGVGSASAPAGKAARPAPASLLVVALAHPVGRRELDWWQEHLPRRTQGNQILADITLGVAAWLAERHGITAWDLPYHPGRGGVYLKDAAVLAGLGCVGRNNLFLAPGHGPRLRLRALALSVALPPDPPSAYDPCDGCRAPCREACPQQALARPLFQGLAAPDHLPARDGSYDRLRCNRQMQADIAAGRQVTPPGLKHPVKQVRYCRRCELACLAR
ncbi:MAG: hypothetical protein KQJ78_18095 [Deltaproteobacteria bacterium]|nr:hypothetical protein [Deltaproteobacteria bacterium]